MRLQQNYKSYRKKDGKLVVKRVQSKSELKRKNLTGKIQKIIKNVLEDGLNPPNDDQINQFNENVPTDLGLKKHSSEDSLPYMKIISSQRQSSKAK